MSGRARKVRQHVSSVSKFPEYVAEPTYQDETPITGLRASNTGPTPFGHAACFHAVVDSGTNVRYEWDCGDGHIAYGSSIRHIYAESGEYLVTVIARNDVSEMEATTFVVVDYLEVWDGSTQSTSSLGICDDGMKDDGTDYDEQAFPRHRSGLRPIEKRTEWPEENFC